MDWYLIGTVIAWSGVSALVFWVIGLMMAFADGERRRVADVARARAEGVKEGRADAWLAIGPEARRAARVMHAATADGPSYAEGES